MAQSPRQRLPLSQSAGSSRRALFFGSLPTHLLCRIQQQSISSFNLLPPSWFGPSPRSVELLVEDNRHFLRARSVSRWVYLFIAKGLRSFLHHKPSFQSFARTRPRALVTPILVATILIVSLKRTCGRGSHKLSRTPRACPMDSHLRCILRRTRTLRAFLGVYFGGQVLVSSPAGKGTTEVLQRVTNEALQHHSVATHSGL